jgi:hypothetical protein
VPQRLVFMSCLGRLLPRTRLYTVAHLGRLAPMLMEWLLALDASSQAAALGCWDALLRGCWLRMGAHGAVIWRHLVAAARGADVMGPPWGAAGARGGEAGGDAQCLAAAFTDVGSLLLTICGQPALALDGSAAACGGGGGGGGGGGEPAQRAAPDVGPCEAALLALIA